MKLNELSLKALINNRLKKKEIKKYNYEKNNEQRIFKFGKFSKQV